MGSTVCRNSWPARLMTPGRRPSARGHNHAPGHTMGACRAYYRSKGHTMGVVVRAYYGSISYTGRNSRSRPATTHMLGELQLQALERVVAVG